jgi:hypothetical protein
MNLRRMFKRMALHRKAVEFRRVARCREIERKQAQRDRDLQWISMRGERFIAAQNRIHLDHTARIAVLYETLARTEDAIRKAEYERSISEGKQIAQFLYHSKKFRKLEKAPL